MPHFVARLSGLPADAVEGLRCPELLASMQRFRSVQQAVADSRDNVSEALYVAAGAQVDRKRKNNLVDLRRSLYNGKRPSRERLAQLDGDAPAHSELVRAFDRLLEDLSGAAAEVEKSYRAAELRVRRNLTEILSRADFQQALLLSSDTLFQNLARYLALESRPSNSRDEQIERGLVRYVTRAAVKATPFATFCAVVPGSVIPPGPELLPALSIEGDGTNKVAHLRLNKRIYASLWAHLRQSAVRKELAIELNPTIEIQAERLAFLASVNGREVFQRLSRTPALDVVIAEARQGNRSSNDLQAALAMSSELDTDMTETDAYVSRLLGIGLLRYRNEVPQQTADWDEPFRELLGRLQHDDARTIDALIRAGDSIRIEMPAVLSGVGEHFNGTVGYVATSPSPPVPGAPAAGLYRVVASLVVTAEHQAAASLFRPGYAVRAKILTRSTSVLSLIRDRLGSPRGAK